MAIYPLSYFHSIKIFLFLLTSSLLCLDVAPPGHKRMHKPSARPFVKDLRERSNKLWEMIKHQTRAAKQEIRNKKKNPPRQKKLSFGILPQHPVVSLQTKFNIHTEGISPGVFLREQREKTKKRVRRGGNERGKKTINYYENYKSQTFFPHRSSLKTGKNSRKTACTVENESKSLKEEVCVVGKVGTIVEAED